MALGKVTTQNKQTIRYEASMSEQVLPAMSKRRCDKDMRNVHRLNGSREENAGHV